MRKLYIHIYQHEPMQGVYEKCEKGITQPLWINEFSFWIFRLRSSQFDNTHTNEIKRDINPNK